MKTLTNKTDAQVLMESEARFRNIVLWSPDAIIVTDSKGKIKYMNPAAEKVFNRKLKSFTGKDFGLPLVDGERSEIDIFRPGKEPGVGDMHVVETEWLNKKTHLITIRDITERKQFLRDLEKRNKELALPANLSNILREHFGDPIEKLLQRIIEVVPLSFMDPANICAQFIYGKKTFKTKNFKKTNPSLKEEAGLNESEKIKIEIFSLATSPVKKSVAVFLDAEKKMIKQFVQLIAEIIRRKNAEEEAAENLQKFEAIFDAAGDGIAAAETKTKRFIFVNPEMSKITGYSSDELLKIGVADIHPAKDMPYIAQQFKLQAAGKISLAKNIPLLRKDGSIFFCDINAKLTAIGKHKYLVGFFRDITHRLELEIILKKSLEDTISIISVAAEKRDPYTAGHQQRVAQLAVAIAKKLNLTDNIVEGIHFGALIHDIGKIYVPSEILSRPGKLTASEWNIIKEHPSIGKDIVKNIDFIWPVKDIVLHHHERLDGSGYPEKLKGKAISIECRIIGVADVVEAMMSHRPYRAALGIDAALDEIKKNKGKFYDPKVVDACVELFEEKFAFGKAKGSSP